MGPPSASPTRGDAGPQGYGEPLIVANCSGFYGDRFEAAEEMVTGGPIDVLTGDYLAELTMAILWRNRSNDPSAGYASTFLQQMEVVLGTCLDRGVRVIANAGGLNPAGLAERLGELAHRLGLTPSIGVVSGDDLVARLGEISGVTDLMNLDTGAPFSEVAERVLTANAYTGGWGIAAALGAGADVVVTGRVADASLVSGPAAWRFGWEPDDWDSLAGAVVAGHIVECGAQCTGGNYSFFAEIPGLEHPGFPIAEVHADGSAVITKHPGTGGAVTLGTVTAQLLYEVAGPSYLHPDVVARFDTIELIREDEDRVAVRGVRGEPAPATIKVGMNVLGGFRNSVTLLVPAPEVEAKAALAETSLRQVLAPLEIEFDLVRSDRPGAERSAEGFAMLRVNVRGSDPASVGRAFSARAVELALAGYPGFTMTAPPGAATPVAMFWPTLVPAEFVGEEVAVDGRTVTPLRPTARAVPDPDEPDDHRAVAAGPEPTSKVPLGMVAGARSGDKGGNANLGVWGRSPEAAAWLLESLTSDRLRALLPETDGFAIDRYEFANLGAVNFVIRGLLGEGVAASTRVDPQAKGLGEFVRTRELEIPIAVAESGAPYDRPDTEAGIR
jgi:hypothetical protein